MRIHCLAADGGGFGWHRIRLPAEAVAAAQPDWTVTIGGDPPDAADVVVLQNVVWPEQVDLIRDLQAAGTAVVVDIDDAVPLIPEGNMAHRIRTTPQHLDTWHKCLALADVVSVSTRRLLRYVPRETTAVLLRNRVPAWWLTLPRYTGPPTIGWSGAVAWHVGDLETMAGAVGRVCTKTGAGFRLTGRPDGVPEALELHPSTRFDAAGWVDFPGYPLSLGKATVGIVPLVDTPFARCKSWIKGLEMAALGVPFVFAGTHPEYRELRLGLAAHTPGQWEQLLTRLLHDEDQREALSIAGREAAQAHTYEANAHHWTIAWELAAQHRHDQLERA